ncbi:MAG: class I SAM-dependent methyltransferase [Candidatus Brocadiia bacterium]
MVYEVFNHQSDRYDAWFESEKGRAVFPAEVECLKRVLPSDLSGWTEIGVGTGRFADALGIPEGVDPSGPMLEKAHERGIRTHESVAEELPYLPDSFDGVLLVVTLCFLDDPERALKEIARVVRPEGQLVIGIVPADSSWGQFYQQKGRKGNPFYSVTRFYSCEESIELAESVGFSCEGGASTLPMGPDDDLSLIPVVDRIDEGFGFVAMSFRLSGADEEV